MNGVYTDYRDITDRIAGRPLWWDEQGVPRYSEFSPGLSSNIYAVEVALVEIACSACGELFQVSFSYHPAGFELPFPEGVDGLADAIRKREVHYVDPPNYGNCQSGPSMSCYDLRVLQYWERREKGYGDWTRDSRLEIELLNVSELPEWLRRDLT
jgi:hypothetical protein